MEQKTLEMRGIPRREFVAYFLELGLVKQCENHFVNKAWQVQVEEEYEVMLGSLRIPQTKLVFIGAAEVLEREIFAFRLRFMRAGG